MNYDNSFVLRDILKLAKDELNEKENIGYTMPDGKHHIFIYVDDVGEGPFYVIEPNQVVDGCHEPMGDTTAAAYNNFEELLIGCMWCLERFVQDHEKEQVKGIDEYSVDRKFKQALSLVDEVYDKEEGKEVLSIANIVHMLKQENILSNEEILSLTQRLYEASYTSAAPLLTAERVDAVRYLLEYGINKNRFDEFPSVSPEQVKEFMLSCDIEIFIDLVETVAVDNQSFYAPDFISDEREKQVSDALLTYVSRKPALENVISGAAERVNSDKNGLIFKKVQER